MLTLRPQTVVRGLCGLLAGLTLAASGVASAQPRSYAPPSAYRGAVVQTPRVAIVFGGRSRSDALARELVNQANAICHEMDQNYKSNRRFREIYREMYSVLEDAKQIRDQVNQGAHRLARRDDDRIAIALHHMDQHFHDIEADMKLWRPDRDVRTTREAMQLDRALDRFEETMHEMMEDYGVRSRLADRGRDDRNDYRDRDRDGIRGPVAPPPSRR